VRAVATIVEAARTGRSPIMRHDISGKKVAILIAPIGTEHVELTHPMEAAERAGAEVTLVGIEAGEAQTLSHDVDRAEAFTVEVVAAEASSRDFDALIIPGGTVGSDRLRGNEDVVGFVRGFFEEGKPVAAICHGPWLLVEADVLGGRTLTSYPTLRTDIRNAGGTWVDREVVTDQGLVTSRKPDDLPAFCDKLVEEIAEGKHAGQARSV
jgi:protease I